MGPRSASGKKSGSNRAGRNGGDNVSIASSSSSSSRRTPGSTPSHPLPPRPDWAVGLLPPGGGQGNRSQSDPQQAQSTQHTHLTQQQSPPSDSGDFPPLSSFSSPPSDRPTFGQPGHNVWSGVSSISTSPGPNLNPATFSQEPTQGPSNGFQHPPHLTHSSSFSSSGSSNSRARLDEQERRFERPRPRGNVELFNPKAKKMTPQSSHSHSQERGSDSGSNRQRSTAQPLPSPSPSSSGSRNPDMEKKRGEAVKNAILVEKIENLSLEEQQEHQQ